MSSLAIFHISIEFLGIIFCLLATNYVFMSLSLQNIALVISTQLVFIVDMTTVVQKPDQSTISTPGKPFLSARSSAAMLNPSLSVYNSNVFRIS